MAMRPVAISEAPVKKQPELELAQWTSSIYQLERDAALEAGFTVGSVSVKGSYRLLVMDVARTAIKQISRHRTETWGHGYRLLIEISNVDVMGSLSLPAIAAKVELGEVEASVRLQVNGFTGEMLWLELPVPKPLDIDTYKEYVAAAGRIQKAFADNPTMAVAIKLAEDDDSTISQGGVNEVELREAVVLVGLLQRAGDKVPRDAAAASLAAETDLSEEVVNRLASGLYTTLGITGDDDSARRGAELADALLQPLR